MIKQLFDILESLSVPYYNSFGVGTDIRKNETGEDDYPLLWVELPLLYNINDNDDTLTINLILNSLVQRNEKTVEEEIDQLDLTDLLLRRYLEDLSVHPAVIDLANQSFITYSGIQLADYSDDLNGIRVEFTLNINICALVETN